MNWPDLDLDDIKDLDLDWGDGEVLGGPPTPAPSVLSAHSLPRTISPSTFINTNTCPVSGGDTNVQSLPHVFMAVVMLTLLPQTLCDTFDLPVCHPLTFVFFPLGEPDSP